MTSHRYPIFAGLILAFGSLSAAADISFDDVSAAAGVDRSGETYGASWGDLDGDGYPDLFVSMHRRQPSLYLNTREGDFIDVATQTQTWITKPNADTHGGTWFDFNNDGTQDLFVTVGRGNPDHFLVNERGALIDRTEDFGFTDTQLGGRLPVWLDYNGDGLPDFILTQYAGNPPLMRQLPEGGFVQENASTGLVCRPGQYAQLLDVTGDGRLDVICPERLLFPHRIWDTLPSRWTLLQNVMEQIESVPDTIIADFDNDGRMDIFVLRGELRPSGASLSGDDKVEARLMGATKGFSFVTDGEVTFELHQEGFGLGRVLVGENNFRPQGSPFTLDPANPAVVGMPPDDPAVTPLLRIGYEPETRRWTVIQRSRNEEGESVWSETYFLISSTAGISDLRTTAMWQTDLPMRPMLLMNRPGGFVDVAQDAGFNDPVQCVSATAGDFNNDMHVDLYLACRTATSNIENMLYMNQGDGTFVKAAGAGGATGPIGMAIADGAGTSDTAVTADYDLDGFLDIFVTNGLNMFPAFVGGPSNLYRNRGNDNNWIHLDLVGVSTHREAVGTIVEASAGNVTQTRVKDGSYHRWSHDHTRMHFGLGQAETVDLKIIWPGGATDTHLDVPANRIYRATENGDLEPVTPGDAPPYPCGLPEELRGNMSAAEFNAALGAGVFIAKDCTKGVWQVRVLSGGSESRLDYAGRIVSTAPFESVERRGVEEFDIFDTSSPSEIGYEFRVRGTDWDGVDFRARPGADTCFLVNPPAGTRVYLGPLKRRVPSQFDMETVGLCPGQEPLPDDWDDDDEDPSGGDDDDGTGGNDDDDGAGGNDDDDDDGAGGNDDDDGNDGAGGNDDDDTGGNDGTGGSDDDDDTGGNDDGGNDGTGGSDSDGNAAGDSGGGSGSLTFFSLAALLGFLIWRRPLRGGAVRALIAGTAIPVAPAARVGGTGCLASIFRSLSGSQENKR